LLQTSVAPGTHTPASQASPAVQSSPSLQVMPSPTFGFEHNPEAGSHTPGSWHRSAAWHTTAAPGTHTPATQASFCVQKLPSVQLLPFALAGFEQAPVAESQVPAR
jgi:hypothetical protein